MWYRSDAIIVPVLATNTRVWRASLMRPHSSNKSSQSLCLSPQISTTGDWLRISVDSSSSPKRPGGSVKNTVATDVDGLLRKLSREQKRMAQLNNAQLTLLSRDLKKENECAPRNSPPDVSRHRCQTGSGTGAHKSPRIVPGSKVQFDGAVKEIERNRRA